MATDSAVTQVGGQIVGKIFSGIIWIGVTLIVIITVGSIMWYFLYYKRKFDIRVLMKSDRAGEKYKIIEDKAAILVDRKNRSKFFRLFDSRIDLPVPPFQVLQATNKGDLIELWRKSEDEIIFLTPPVINKQYVVRQDGSLFPVAEREQKQVEGDIAFWNVKRKDRNKGMFDTESLLMKILPWLPQIIGGMLMIFMLYILMDSMPQILNQLTELTKELQTLKGAQVTTYS